MDVYFGSRRQPIRKERAPRVAGPFQLTRRQKDLCRLLIAGKRNKDIMAELNISENTVKGYLHKLFGKIGVDSRLGAAMWALRNQELIA